MLRNNLDFKVEKLLHPEIATNAYYAAENKFNKSAAKVEEQIRGYDNEWRRAILFGDSFFYSKETPSNSAEAAMKRLLNSHKKNAMELNKIIAELNKIPYTPIVECKKKVSISDSANRERVLASKQKARKGSQSASTQNNNSDSNSKPNDFWGGTANWY